MRGQQAGAGAERGGGGIDLLAFVGAGGIQRTAQHQVGKRRRFVHRRIRPDGGLGTAGATGDVDAGGDAGADHFAFGTDVDARVGDGVIAPDQFAARDLQLLPIRGVAPVYIEPAGGGHFATLARAHVHGAGERAFQAITIEPHRIAQGDGHIQVQARAGRAFRVGRVQHHHVLGNRYPVVEFFHVDDGRRYLHLAAHLDGVVGETDLQIGRGDRLQFGGIGNQEILAADVELQRRAFHLPIQRAVYAQGAAVDRAAGGGYRFQCAVDTGAAVGLGVQIGDALGQGDAQRRQFALELGELRIAAQRRRSARAGQAHMPLQLAGGTHQIGREKLHPEQARVVEIDIAFHRRELVPAGGDGGVDETVALEAGAQPALDGLRIEIDIQGEVVVAHDLTAGVVAQLQTAIERTQVHFADPRLAGRLHRGVQLDVAAQGERAAIAGRQPRLQQGQRQRIGMHLDSLFRPVGLGTQCAAAAGGQARWGKRERRTVLRVTRGLLQTPAAAFGRRELQCIEAALPVGPAFQRGASERHRTHRIAGIAVELQVLHRAARIDPHAVQHHADIDRRTAHRQFAVAALPWQPAANAERLGGIAAPLERRSGQVRIHIGCIAGARELQRAGDAAAGVRQQIVQMQRPQTCVDVQAVADLALGVDAAVAQRERQFAVAFVAAQRELAAAIQLAPTQAAAQLGYVQRRIEAAGLARLPFAGEVPGHVAFPVG